VYMLACEHWTTKPMIELYVILQQKPLENANHAL